MTDKASALFAKRLERGRFIWPSPADGTVTITPAQLGYLLEGIDWRMLQHTWRAAGGGVIAAPDQRARAQGAGQDAGR